MARSHYVYIVADMSNLPVAAFTVKRERDIWLERHPSSSYRLYRIKDGLHWEPGETLSVG